MSVAAKPRWYAVHVFSGSEDRVIRAIQEKAEKEGMTDHFVELLAPKEEVVEMRRGVKKNVQKTFFSGYVLLHMILNDASMHLVCSIDRVTGFLGNNKPAPLSQAEVAQLKGVVEEAKTKPEEKTVEFTPGETVGVISGVFSGLNGVVESVIQDKGKNRLKVSAMVFGRPTLIEVDFFDVEKKQGA